MGRRVSLRYLPAAARYMTKCGGNRGVSIVLHEFVHKLRADGIGVEELPYALRFILLQIAPAFLQAPEHIVEPCHHFLPFLRVEIDANAIVTCQEFGGPVYLRGWCSKMMSFEKGFHLCFGCRRKLILMKLLYIFRHRLAI